MTKRMSSTAPVWRARAGSRDPPSSSRAPEESCSKRPEPRGLAAALDLAQSSPTATAWAIAALPPGKARPSAPTMSPERTSGTSRRAR